MLMSDASGPEAAENLGEIYSGRAPQEIEAGLLPPAPEGTSGARDSEDRTAPPDSAPLRQSDSRWDDAPVDEAVNSPGPVRFRRLLLGFDLTSITLACLIGVIFVSQASRSFDSAALLLSILLAVPIWCALGYAGGLYHNFESRIGGGLTRDFLVITVVSTAWIWILVVIRLGVSGAAIQLPKFVVIWASMLVLIPLGRSLARRYASHLGWMKQRVAIIGDLAAIEAVLERIARHRDWELEPVLGVEVGADAEGRRSGGWRPSEPYSSYSSSDRPEWIIAPMLDSGQILDLVEARELDRVVIAGGFGGYRDLADRTEFIHQLQLRGYLVDLVSGGPETVFPRSLVNELEDVPVLTIRTGRRRRLSLAFKRLSDVLLATVGLVVFSPVLAWAAIRIKLESNGPVLYRQTRWGLNQQEFEMVKLRTMVEGAHAKREQLRAETRDQGNDDVLFKLKDDPRVTRVGRSLRRWSIDELPQLWNVLRGEMSMVGPRPLVPEEASEAERVFPGRSSVKPGVAGPWQAMGRNTIPFEDMVKLDSSYVLGSSTGEDFRLLISTVGAVIRRRGAM